MAELRHVAGIRLPLSLVQEMALMTQEFAELGLSGLPHNRTDFVIQAVRAYLPQMKQALEDQKARLNVAPRPAVRPQGGQLGRLG